MHAHNISRIWLSTAQFWQDFNQIKMHAHLFSCDWNEIETQMNLCLFIWQSNLERPTSQKVLFKFLCASQSQFIWAIIWKLNIFFVKEKGCSSWIFPYSLSKTWFCTTDPACLWRDLSMKVESESKARRPRASVNAECTRACLHELWLKLATLAIGTLPFYTAKNMVAHTGLWL